VLGANHPDTAQSYHNIGVMLLNTEYHEGGLKALENALYIKQKILGKDHPSTTILTSDLIQEPVGQKQSDEEFIDNPRQRLEHLKYFCGQPPPSSEYQASVIRFNDDSGPPPRRRLDHQASIMIEFNDDFDPPPRRRLDHQAPILTTVILKMKEFLSPASPGIH